MNPNTKLTLQQVESAVARATYTRLPSGKAIVCEITMTNGFVVHGISELIDLDNYDEVMGKQAAYSQAKQKVWDFMAYEMQELIHRGEVESKHDELVAQYEAEHGVQPQAI